MSMTAKLPRLLTQKLVTFLPLLILQPQKQVKVVLVSFLKLTLNLSLPLAPTAAPQSPTGEAVTSTTITLEWDPPPDIDINGEIEFYVVEVEEVYTEREWTFHAVDDFINIGSLIAYNPYRCKIAAYTIELGPYTDYFVVYSGEVGKLIKTLSY